MCLLVHPTYGSTFFPEVFSDGAPNAQAHLLPEAEAEHGEA